MKARIIWNKNIRAWEIVGTGSAWDDLSVAYDVAVGKRWMTPKVRCECDLCRIARKTLLN